MLKRTLSLHKRATDKLLAMPEGQRTLHSWQDIAYNVVYEYAPAQEVHQC